MAEQTKGLPAGKGTIQVEWEQWELVRHSGTLSELLILYQDKLKNETTTHGQLVKIQTKECRDMITNCDDTTVIVHVDFSEAWKCKYAPEIQACHYGQNLPQITPIRACTTLNMKRQDSALSRNPNVRMLQPSGHIGIEP